MERTERCFNWIVEITRNVYESGYDCFVPNDNYNQVNRDTDITSNKDILSTNNNKIEISEYDKITPDYNQAEEEYCSVEYVMDFINTKNFFYNDDLTPINREQSDEILNRKTKLNDNTPVEPQINDNNESNNNEPNVSNNTSHNKVVNDGTAIKEKLVLNKLPKNQNTKVLVATSEPPSVKKIAAPARKKVVGKR